MIKMLLVSFAIGIWIFCLWTIFVNEVTVAEREGIKDSERISFERHFWYRFFFRNPQSLYRNVNNGGN